MSAGEGAVLVLVEHADAIPLPASLAVLASARELALALGAPLEAVALGSGSAGLASALGAAGVVALHAGGDGDLVDTSPYDTPAVPGRLLAELLVRSGPAVILAAATVRGTETIATAAALAGVQFAAGCIALAPAGPGRLDVTRLRWGGSVLEDASLVGATVCATIAVEGAAAPAPAAQPVTTRVETLRVEARGADRRVRLVGRAAASQGGTALASARVVVGGGRGVGGPERFGPLEELAAALGGAVGVSRVVTSAGWRPHAEQVGQTGTRIAPDLYIACGISGAIQHVVGCRGARAILAINTDPDAPIMARASHAVIGDLHEVVPAIVAELRRRGLRST